ncbi:MAG TPA: trimeric intracellular cation channel family protein [Crinalium sp.]|jgi:uncharacterized membrane protein YeiH
MSIDVTFTATLTTQLQRFSFLGYAIEAGAVIVAAISGMVAAHHKRLDLVGTYIVAFVTAFGGGTLRDLLLDRRPLFWVEHPEYPIIIFVLSVAFTYAPEFFSPDQSVGNRLFDLVDALGLALFSLSGVSYALAGQIPYFVASLLGVITGVFGGVLRDILLAEIPMIFRTQTSLYATCSFMGCWGFLISLFLGATPTTAAFIGFTITVMFRVISIQYHLTLPTPRYLKPKSRSHRES